MSDAPDRRILPYVSAVIMLGGLSAAWLLLKTPVPYGEFLSPVIFVFTLCSIVGEAVPLKVFRGNMEGELSTSTTFAVAMMLWAGPGVAFVALSGANVIADLVRGKPPHRIAFNIGQYAISLTVSGLVLKLTTDLPHAHAGLFSPGDLPGVILAGLVFWFVNVALVATVIAMVQGLAIMRYLIHEWLFQASTAGMLLCGLGPVLVVVADFSLPAVILLFLPLYAIHRGSRHAIAKEHQSLHDALTGLPNRLLFRDRVDQSDLVDQRSGELAAVMLMDLDHFKEINDTLGHHHGDRLLEEVAQRLQGALRESDTVARLGGDEFGVLLPKVSGPEAATEVANDLLEHLREPFLVDDLTLEVDASIGVALSPATAATPRRCSSAPTSRCTARSPRPAARCSSRPPRTATARAASRSPASCARRSPTARSSSTSSPRPTCARARSSASRRWRAGITRASASSGRLSSCRSPSRRA